MGYFDSYHGARYVRRKRLKIVLLCLALLLVLLVIAFFMLQDHIIYTDDGGFRFDFQQDVPSADPDPDGNPTADGDVPLIVEGEDGQTTTPGGTDTPAGQETPPADPPASAQSAFSGVVLTPEEILSGASLAEGCDAVAVTVKGADGICWVADPMNAEGGTAADATAFQAALAKLDCRKIAIVSVMLDPIRPRTVDRASACKLSSGSIWLDWDYTSWFDPYASGTADYLKGLLQSCADAGFDEVVLTDFQFPVRGKTELIDYGDQTTPKASALAALAETLKRDDLTVSCLLTDTAAAGVDEKAGQDAAALAEAFGRVWYRCKTPEDAAGLQALVGADAVALWLTQPSDSPDLPAHITAQ